MTTNTTAANTEGLSFMVELTIAPESVDQFLKLFKEVMELASREPECMSFEVFRDPEKPNHFKWVENWSKNMEWFMEVRVQTDGSELR